MAGFQVGSIFAKIGLDPTPFKKGADETLRAARKLSQDVTAALTRTGANLGKKILGVDDKELARQALNVRKIFKALVTGANREFRNFREVQLSKLGLSRVKLAKSFGELRGEFARFAQVAGRELSVIGDKVAPKGSGIRQFLARSQADAERAGVAIRAALARGLVVPGERVVGGLRSALGAIPALVERSIVTPFRSAFRSVARFAERSIAEPFRQGFAGIPDLARRRVLLPLERTFQEVQDAARRRLILPEGFSRSVEAVGRTFGARLVAPLVSGLSQVSRAAGSLLSALSPLGRITIAGSRVALQALQTGLLAIGRSAAIGVGVATKALNGLSVVARRTAQAVGLIGKLALAEFKVVAGAVSLILKPFTLARDFFFSLKGIIAGFAGVQLINIAKDAEKTGAAFDSLSKEIGATSDAFLRKLKVATDGTISDLRLLKLANEAVLLGVATSADQFADLAGKVGKLGETFGQTSAESIETFVQGVGTLQSRTLKSIGIVVEAEEAFAEYALSVGKVGQPLTQLEERTAFAALATRRLNEQVSKLSGIATPVTRGFERLQASLQNTFAVIAGGIVGGRVPEAIADILDQNRARIAAFAKFVGNVLGAVVDGIQKLIDDIQSGQITAESALRGLSEFVTSAIVGGLTAAIQLAFAALKAAVINFLPAILALVTRLILDLIPVVVGEFVRLIFLAVREIAPLLANVAGIGEIEDINAKIKSLKDAFKFGFGGRADPEEIKRRAFEEIELLNKFRQEAIKKQPDISVAKLDELSRAESLRLIQARKAVVPEEDFLSKTAIDNFIQGIQKLASDTGDILGNSFKPAAESLEKNFAGPVKAFFGRIGLAAKQVGIDIRDGLASFRPVQVDSSIQSISDLLTVVVNLRRRLIETGNVLFENPIFEKLSGVVITKAKSGIEGLSSAIVKLRKFLQPAGLDAAAFTKELEQIIREVEALEAEAAGADQASSRLNTLANAIEALRAKAKPQQQGAIDATAARAITAAVSGELNRLNAELQKIGLTEADVKSLEISRAFAALKKAAAGTPEILEEISGQLEELSRKPFEIEVKLKVQELKTQVDQLQREVGGFGLSPGQSAAQEADLLSQRVRLDARLGRISEQQEKEQIAALARERERALRLQGVAEFQGLTKGISTALFQGIVDGFERGESASKIWAAFVSDVFRQSFTKVIDGLTTTISRALSGVFSQLGLGLGAADFATGLLGIGSAILVGLRNKSTSQVQDFSQAVNSSEAIRGVVAGPTNVAIAKVGDSLKVALRTTETLLERIAVSVERGGGGGGTTPAGFNVRLTPPTTS